MNRSLNFAVCATLLFAGEAIAQTAEEATTNASSSPVAYVYVARPTHVDGFAVAANGKLTPVPGSPFANIALTHLNVNNNYLFGPGADGASINSYSIASNGSLKAAGSVNAQKYNSDNCGGFGPTSLDATGTTLYNIVNSECEVLVQSFKIESNGEFQYLGVADSGVPGDLFGVSNVAVLENNKFAFQTLCGGDSFPGGGIVEYKRESNGLLAVTSDRPEIPPTKKPDDTYCPYFTIATDSSDHFAMVLSPLDDSWDQDGPDAIATYSVGSNGAATTKSTYENMPSDAVDGAGTMSISPSSKLLAIGGDGFQVFHFNGGSQVTKYSGAIQKGNNFIQFCWDSDNHLFALSDNGKVFVYTVTPTTITEASGSPYSIPEAGSIIALSK